MSKKNISISEVILYFAYKYKSNWNDIFQAIALKEDFEKDEDKRHNLIFKKGKLNTNFFTITDDEYPKCLTETIKPPFIVFYEGNKKLLYECNKITLLVNQKHKYLKNKDFLNFLRVKSLNCVFVVSLNNKSFINDLLRWKIRFIAISSRSIQNKNDSLFVELIKDSGNLVISEITTNSTKNKEDCFYNRLLFGIGDSILNLDEPISKKDPESEDIINILFEETNKKYFDFSELDFSEEIKILETIKKNISFKGA